MRTILLVQEYDISREVFQRALKSAGFQVVAVKNAPDALRAVSGIPSGFDLLVTDVFLDGMCGADLALDLQRRRPELEVIYTSPDCDSVLVDALTRGEGRVLRKPAEPEELVRLCGVVAPLSNRGQHLARRRVTAPRIPDNAIGPN